METIQLLTLTPMIDRQPAGGRSTNPSTTTAPSGFQALGVSPDLTSALAARGIDSPFPVQAATIPDALAGRDVCGKARTGSGKTLAFGLPLLQVIAKSEPRRPRAVVLVPTRELAAQVVAELGPLGSTRRVRVAAVYGGVSLTRQADRLRAGVDIVVATPGRLHDLLQRNALTLDHTRIAVLDEADQMADFGFLPQVERILDRIPGEHQTLLFSATLDGDIDRLVRRYQTDPVFHNVVTETEDEPAMAHRFIAVPEADKVRMAANIAAGPGRTLVFVRTQRGADRLVRLLEREGLAAAAIHGGLSQNKRERALAAFSRGTAPVLVATNIAARGIHVDGVEIVVHHDPPEDAKTYLHRSGRTARAGASGVVVTLVSPEQRRDVDALRREAGVREAIVPMTPDDVRLRDLGAWTPPIEEPSPPAPARGQQGHAPFRPRSEQQRSFVPRGRSNTGHQPDGRREPRRPGGEPSRNTASGRGAWNQRRRQAIQTREAV